MPILLSQHADQLYLWKITIVKCFLKINFFSKNTSHKSTFKYRIFIFFSPWTCPWPVVTMEKSPLSPKKHVKRSTFSQKHAKESPLCSRNHTKKFTFAQKAPPGPKSRPGSWLVHFYNFLAQGVRLSNLLRKERKFSCWWGEGHPEAIPVCNLHIGLLRSGPVRMTRILLTLAALAVGRTSYPTAVV